MNAKLYAVGTSTILCCSLGRSILQMGRNSLVLALRADITALYTTTRSRTYLANY